MAENSKKKVLLVEDDVFMIELLAKELTNEGFDVISAKTGLEAVQKFQEVFPDVTLMDLLLPDQNGLETVRQIRRLPNGVNAKILMLSNIAEGGEQEEAKRLGVLDYLIKANFGLPEVVQKIKAAM